MTRRNWYYFVGSHGGVYRLPAESPTGDTPTMSTAPTGNKYVREITSRTTPSCRINVDVYCVLKAFDVTSAPIAHAVKKLLCPGNRGKGSYRQDLVEARDAITRAIEQEDEDTNRLTDSGVYTGDSFAPPQKPLEP